MLPVFNPKSGTHLSLLLFGGSLTVEVSKPLLDSNGCPIVFKTGKNTGAIKTKKVTEEVKIKSLGLNPVKEWETKKPGIYSVDETKLKVIEQGTGDAKEIASIMLKIRGLEKELSTYYNGIEELTYDIDACVHANFNMVSTDTGRMSCNKPNLQNIPKSKVKEIFISRY